MSGAVKIGNPLGFLSPKGAVPVSPPPPPPTSEDASARAQDEADSLRRRRGMASTILSRGASATTAGARTLGA